MTIPQLMQRFREEFADQEEPYLISNQALLRYIDDAQKMFCRLTYGIEATQGRTIKLHEGRQWYDLEPDTLDIRHASFQRCGLKIVPADQLGRYGIELTDDRQGHPQALITGLEKNKVFVYPAPGEQHTGEKVQLAVYRLPETIECSSDELEIDEHHHLHLLHWVKHLAYTNHDADAFDKRRSDEYEAMFRSYCAQAKAEQNRAYHPAGTVMYGGY